MKKMRLELETLEVESFETGYSEAGGTVRGHGSEDGTCVTLGGACLDTDPNNNGGPTCSCNANTCYDTCFNSCQPTCPYPNYQSCGGTTCQSCGGTTCFPTQHLTYCGGAGCSG